MSNKQIFSKVIPNVKLRTRFDADGNEIDVEIREDTEASQCRKKILDLLLSAGYFRSMIKNLSDFDKIIGGVVWCIEACEFDVDVDLLFHENLSIGQKIALTERVVKVLPLMKCPFVLEPHQIQGLDFISIFPVVQWLIKESVQKRSEKSERLRSFAVGQFHNHFNTRASFALIKKRDSVLDMVRNIEDLYAAKRQYKRKQNAEPDDEQSRVRLTLLEYGVKSIARSAARQNERAHGSIKEEEEEELSGAVEQDEIDVEKLVSENLALAKEEIYDHANLTEEERQEVARHYENLKREMLIDAKQLSEQHKVKNLEAMELALEKRLQRIMHENEELSDDIKIDSDKLEAIRKEAEEFSYEMRRLEIQEQHVVATVKEQIKNLILENEKLKLEEMSFKEDCRRKIEELHREIEEAEKLAETPDEEVTEYDEMLAQEQEKLRVSRLQLAKKNRTVTSLQRQIDNIPDSIELSQYQKRFLELYNQIGSKYKETKQFYALFNTLNDKHLYLDKELTLLNSLYDNYNQAMLTVSSREQFLKKLEDIVEGVSSTKSKFRKRCDDEKAKRDDLNGELLSLIDLQRKYAALIKKFKIIFNGK